MKYRKPVILGMVALVLCWVLFFVTGRRIAPVIATTWNAPIARIAKGKIADPANFVYHRALDALWLSTLAIALAALFLWLRRRPGITRITNREIWTFYSVVLFVGLNVWVGAAMRRPLFWALLYCGEGTSNYTQFKLKETLAAEGPPIRRAILLGSSQTRAQIDENLLNAELTNQLWTTELHFPGSTAFDVALVTRHLQRVPADFLIVYISEGYFFSGAMHNTVPYFVSFRDIPWLSKMGATDIFKTREFYIGLLGRIAPLFRSREPLAQRLLGTTFTELKQAEYDEALETNLVKRAEQAAQGLKPSAHTAVAKRAFDAFLQEAATRRSQVLILVGQFNPVLAEQLDPAMRADMLQFLHEMARKYQHVGLIEGAPFLNNIAAEYQDLSHITPEAQERFTKALADLLRSKYLKGDAQ